MFVTCGSATSRGAGAARDRGDSVGVDSDSDSVRIRRDLDSIVKQTEARASGQATHFRSGLGGCAKRKVIRG